MNPLTYVFQREVTSQLFATFATLLTYHGTGRNPLGSVGVSRGATQYSCMNPAAARVRPQLW